MILPVTEDGVRPAGSPNKCFYCGEPKGAPHAADCVIPQRTVVLAMTIEYVVSIPAYWDASQVEFHRNDSSWCSANDLWLIADQADAAGENMCNTCGRTEFRFIREATEKDMEEMGYNANKRQARAKEAASGPSLRGKEPEWISVKERLPREMEFVLVFRPRSSPQQRISQFVKERFHNFDKWPMPFLAGVTHWMPLPAPPKTEAGK
jgi:hypothetical protein